ncbi:molecular chaperone DnaJ [Thalassotalea mangrovi]|uniref:Molecular chaperone DnaJ n=1 Tax=Thalassotalea mangrovi TaxID=2572245 RepID=A0A4U1B4X5_9GAMM|nr:molecular chaperone DnaJ [Thalassotalea mangrovi]TKB45369.1 molecular chaperone DnaJ [Thalassotalea mangrovi]
MRIKSFLLLLIIATSSHAKEESAIGYGTVDAALTALKEKPDTKLSVQGGWTIIEDKEDGNFVLWSFTPESHEAHPAAVKRTILEKDKHIYVRMSALCQAEKEPCDKLMEQFEQLNKQIMAGR